MKYILTILILAVLGAGGFYYWKQKANGKPVAEQSQQRIVTAKVEARDISFAVTAAGDIGPADQVSVRSEVNGRIAELPVDIGDKMKKNQLMCRLDDQDLQIERDQRLTEINGAKLQIEGTRLQLEKAERDFDRNKELFEKSLISKETFENQRTELELMRNQIQVAKNSLERADMMRRQVEDRITKTKLLAPFDCTVLTRPVSLGQTVSGAAGFNAGTEIMTIANLNDMIVNAHINQADVTRLSTNQAVDIQVESLPGAKMKGIIERIAPQATIKNGIKGFAARIEIKEMDARVRPGMTATLMIPIAMADNVVAVPLSAVFTEEGERFVFIKKEETFEKRNVQIGVTDYQFAEVQQGVAVGEEVFIEPPKEALAQISGKEGKDKEGKTSKDKDGKGSKSKGTAKSKDSSATKQSSHGT